MLHEIETQQTINGVTIIDRTTQVVNECGTVLEEWYSLIISSRDTEGNPRFSGHTRCVNKFRHMNKKDAIIKRLSPKPKHHSTHSRILAGL